MFDVLESGEAVTVAEARRIADCAQGTILAAIRRGDVAAQKVSAARTAPYLCERSSVVSWAEARKTRRNVAAK